jgi:hypothetical protein
LHLFGVFRAAGEGALQPEEYWASFYHLFFRPFPTDAFLAFAEKVGELSISVLASHHSSTWQQRTFKPPIQSKGLFVWTEIFLFL